LNRTLIPQALALVLLAGLLACNNPAPAPLPPINHPATTPGHHWAPPPQPKPEPPAPVHPLPTPYSAPRTSIPSYAPAPEVIAVPVPKAPRREPVVYIAKTGNVYHNADCVHLRHAKVRRKMTLSEAKEAGHPNPCIFYKPE
jgi:hypothetical protein